MPIFFSPVWMAKVHRPKERLCCFDRTTNGRIANVCDECSNVFRELVNQLLRWRRPYLGGNVSACQSVYLERQRRNLRRAWWRFQIIFLDKRSRFLELQLPLAFVEFRDSALAHADHVRNFAFRYAPLVKQA